MNPGTKEPGGVSSVGFNFLHPDISMENGMSQQSGVMKLSVCLSGSPSFGR